MVNYSPSLATSQEDAFVVLGMGLRAKKDRREFRERGAENNRAGIARVRATITGPSLWLLAAIPELPPNARQRLRLGDFLFATELLGFLGFLGCRLGLIVRHCTVSFVKLPWGRRLIP
jgi:hypothetical protein